MRKYILLLIVFQFMMLCSFSQGQTYYFEILGIKGYDYSIDPENLSLVVQLDTEEGEGIDMENKSFISVIESYVILDNNVVRVDLQGFGMENNRLQGMRLTVHFSYVEGERVIAEKTLETVIAHRYPITFIGDTLDMVIGNAGTGIWLEPDGLFLPDLFPAAGQTETSELISERIAVKVYPNPIPRGGIMNIAVNTEEEVLKRSSLKLYDVSGQLIQNSLLEDKLTSVRLNSNSGIYVLIIEFPDGSRTIKKVLVQ